ncbi:MAG: Dps family protein [Flavobacterium sp.]|jgi:starvation-inducible DNA-binding protein
MKNSIGISIEKANELNHELNLLLSNFQVYYQNLRGLHWNIKGKRFFDLHLKFEEFYNDAQLKIDLIAERILTLGGSPLHTFEDYLQKSTIKIGKNIFKDEVAIQLIVSSLHELLILERKILIIANEAQDEGTNSMISDFILEQEKTNWMLRSWLEDKV